MRLRIGAQIAAGFAVPVGALALAAVAVVVGFEQTKAAKDEVLLKTELRSHARDIRLQASLQREAVVRFALTRRPTALSSYQDAETAASDDSTFFVENARGQQAAKDAAASITGLLGAIQARDQVIVSTATRDPGAVIAAYGGAHRGAAAKIAGALEANGTDEAQLDSTLDVLMRAENAAAAAAGVAFDRRVRLVEGVVVTLAIVALIVSALVAFSLASRIRRRLGRVAQRLVEIVHDDFARLGTALDQLADGDLRVAFRSEREPLRDTADDEIGEVVAAYNTLVGGLATIGDRLTTALERLRGALGSARLAERRPRRRSSLRLGGPGLASGRNDRADRRPRRRRRPRSSREDRPSRDRDRAARRRVLRDRRRGDRAGDGDSRGRARDRGPRPRDQQPLRRRRDARRRRARRLR
jgi:hypothetical protein